jgi:hypothetical protein
MSRLRRTGLTIDDPLLPGAAEDHVTPARSRDDELVGGSSGGSPAGSTLSPKAKPSAAPRSTARQATRTTPAATSAARTAPTQATTATPANGAWRAWGGQTRVASYRLPDELLAELASTSAELQLPVGLLVTAAIAHLLDEPADSIARLVDRADDARIEGRRAARRGLTTTLDDADVASDTADTL